MHPPIFLILLCMVLFLSETSLVADAVYRDDGALLSRTTDEGMEAFSYDPDGRLVQCKRIGSDGSVTLTWYCYDLASGRLAFVQEAERNVWFDPDGKTFALDDKTSYEEYEKLGNSYYLRTHIVDGKVTQSPSSVKLDQEGNLIHGHQQGGRDFTEVYDAQGNLIEETVTQEGVFVMKTVRTYDSHNQLLRALVTYADGRTEERHYASGILASQTNLVDGVIEKETSFLPDKVETVYSNGVPYARISYKADGRSINKVEYL